MKAWSCQWTESSFVSVHVSYSDVLRSCFTYDSQQTSLSALSHWDSELFSCMRWSFLSCEVYLSPDYPLTEPNPFVGVEDQRILNRSQVVRREDVWCTATSRLQSIAVPSSSLYSSTPRQTKHPSYACKQISEAELKLGFTVWKREYIRCTSTDKLLLLFIQWDTTAQWYSKSVGICAERRSIRLGVDSATWVHL